jgi:hypothetical protein
MTASVLATEPVDRFINAILDASCGSTDAFADDAVLDATVPNWRFVVRGGAAISEEFAKWFDHPASFDELRRTPLPDGELVEYTLAWTEDGVVHKTHQSHHLIVHDGKIVSDTAWCGGRWPASLLAEMGGV